MFPTLIRRSLPPKVPEIYTSPYKAQRQWPPDFSKLSQRHQFRLERKYKRRSKLKWARPTWTKWVKITQMSSVIFVVVYSVLFLDWSKQAGPGQKPFDGTRKWFFGLGDSIWTKGKVQKTDGQDDKYPSTKAGN